MVKFRASFWDFIKDPIGSALLLALFSHAKVMFQAHSLLNIVSLEPVLLHYLVLSRLNLYTLTRTYFENYYKHVLFSHSFCIVGIAKI